MKQSGGGNIDGVEIKNPESLRDLDVDVILLGTLMGLDEVPDQLNRLCITNVEIDRTYVEISIKF